MLVSGILNDVENFNNCDHRIQYEKGLSEAESARHRILLKSGNGFKRKLSNRLINVYRSSAGLREHHKHMITMILNSFKQAVMQEAQRLTNIGVLHSPEDVYWLELNELISISSGTFKDNISAIIKERKSEFEHLQSMTVPRVMTSEGEIIIASSKKGDYPNNALIGTAASAGIAEGIARVILSPEKSRLNDGEILVAPNTDPGWTPLFQAAKAVVTEVGGLMTHGSVVAREYGIPAVVGIDNVSSLIQDGQCIRVNGTCGYVEVLDE